MVLIKKKIYFKNTLTGQKELFKSNKRNRVGMYHCGPTVYNKAHIGNLTAYIFADVLRRLFEQQKYLVSQVINVTDVGHLTDDADDGDDKMESAARKTGFKVSSIAQKYFSEYLADLISLNVEVEKIIFPKATDHIEEQIELIQKIEKGGYTYTTSDGIYFDTKKFPGYGALGKVDIDGLKEGARVEINKEKKNPTDFALWKFSKSEDKRQQEWSSPWGVGFPGWHIECSAMARKYLGQNFDIHTGGIDHIQIHHNNEIAQSKAADGELLANYWLHANHILLNGQKISKSVGNVLYLSDFVEKNINIAIFRYWYLTSHYSSSVNFTWDSILAVKKPFDKIVVFIKSSIKEMGIGPNNLDGIYKFRIESVLKKANKKYYNRALESLNQDVNTAGAIAVISEIIKDVNLNNLVKMATILKIDQILGIGFMKHALNLIDGDAKIPTEVIALAEKRNLARLGRKFEESDLIRDEIQSRGYDIIDQDESYVIKSLK